MTQAVMVEQHAPRALRWGWFQWWYVALFCALNTTTPLDWGYSVADVNSFGFAARMALLENGNIYRRIGVPLLVLLAAIAWWKRRPPRVTLEGILPVTAFLFICLSFVSVTWSDEPAFVMRKLVVFVALLIAGYVFAYRFSVLELLKFCVFGGVLTIAMGFGAELAHQSFQPLSSTYRFSGIMHPNAMAANCAIAFLGAIAWARREPEKKLIMIWIAVIAMIFLFLTKSRTAFGAAIAGGMIYGAVSATRARLTTVVLALATFTCFAFAVGSEELLDPLRDAVLMGRGEEAATGTLSNRLPLWEECFEYISQRPWSGYGYQSFWTPDRTAEISAHQGWVMAHSHNELIEMALGLGIVGAILYGIVMYGGAAKAIVMARRWGDPDWAFLASIMVFWVLNLLLEVGGLVPALAPFVALIVMFRVIAPLQEEAY